MKKIVIANLKMYKTPSEMKNYMTNLVARFDPTHVDLTICVPYTSLTDARYILEGSEIKYGAQNICDEEVGKFTGEISGAMLKDVGTSLVLVGHSERRFKFKENSKILNKKIKLALKNGLGVVLCVGESLSDKNTLKTLDTLKMQIEEALKGLYENELEKVIIAYEPVWAIGTGQHASQREIEYAAKVIRKVISDDFSLKASKEISVIYGGSLTGKNLSILSAKGIDGAMVGASSIDVNNFLGILSLIK